jgi:hypothetical protein
MNSDVPVVIEPTKDLRREKRLPDPFPGLGRPVWRAVRLRSAADRARTCLWEKIRESPKKGLLR